VNPGLRDGAGSEGAPSSVRRPSWPELPRAGGCGTNGRGNAHALPPHFVPADGTNAQGNALPSDSAPTDGTNAEGNALPSDSVPTDGTNAQGNALPSDSVPADGTNAEGNALPSDSVPADGTGRWVERRDAALGSDAVPDQPTRVAFTPSERAAVTSATSADHRSTAIPRLSSASAHASCTAS